MARRRKKSNKTVFILLLLIWFAYNRFAVEDVAPAPVQNGIQGEWRAYSDDYAAVSVFIDADSVRVTDGGKEICDEPYAYDERTKLLTGAYRQDFELFALFEYRDGEEGVNGNPVLIGNAILPSGGHEEILFGKK